MTVTTNPARAAGRALRVVQILTKQDIGGAQMTALEASISQSGDIEIELWVGADDDSGGRFLAAAHELGVTVRVVPTMRRRIGPVGDLLALRRLIRNLRATMPDVVHTHSSKAGVLGRIAARRLRIPAVHSVHGWSFHAGLNPVSFRLAATIERALARVTTAFVVVTIADLDNATRAGVGRPDQFRVIRSGIRLADLRYAPSRRTDLCNELGIGESARIIGNIGRLATAKDPLLLIDAFEAITPRADDVHLVMIGDGHLRDVVAARVATASSNVHLLPGRPGAAEWISSFDLFALSSLHEGLPRTLVEAMAVGVPVVAPLINGIPELIEPGVTGFGWTDRDPGSVGAAMAAALEDPRRAEIVVAARRRVAPFDVAVMRAEMARLWMEVAHQSPVDGDVRFERVGSRQ